MGRRLRMTAELSDWLAELGESEPPAAAEVGAALVALTTCEDPAGLAAVGEPAKPDPRQTADLISEQLAENLRLVRRGASDVASARNRAELRLRSRRAAGADSAELGTLEAELATAAQREKHMAQLSDRLQRQVDEFRTAREVAKATYTAAEAQLRVADALADMSEFEEVASAAETVKLREGVLAAETRLRELAGQAQPADGPAPDLLELRADPLGSDTRILFAVEPADTITLLAVLEGPEAISEHGAAALSLAGELLTEIREHGWPADVDPVLLADQAALLARFFPADDGAIARRAAVLASTLTLARLRVDRGLTIADVATRSGLSADRVAAIEQLGLRDARVHEAVALARALGARLELPGGAGAVAG